MINKETLFILAAYSLFLIFLFALEQEDIILTCQEIRSDQFYCEKR